jgi:quinol monooxygenase YgiN
MRFLFLTASLLMVLLAPLPQLPAQEKESPIEKEVKANLKDPTKPFMMLVHIKIKDGMAAKFEAAFAKARTETRKEKGNKAYRLNRSAKQPNEYVLYERWDNFAALQAHLKAPYITKLLADVGSMFDGPPELKVYLPRAE